MTTSIGARRRVIVGPVRFAELCVSARAMLLAAGFELVENLTTVPWTADDLAPLLPTADAAICGVEVYDAAALAQAPNLRVIARMGVGLDNIDLAAARANNTAVSNVPGGNASAVGELALTLILAVLRKLTIMDRDLRQNRWDRYVGRELAGKTVGLVGFGATARELAKRLSGFGVIILAADPVPNRPAAAALGVQLRELTEVLSAADVISVHAPHVPATHHLIGAQALNLVRPGAILINTSRGGLVDEAALVAALESGRLAGAGLDVFEREPLTSDNPLLAFEQVVMTPHAAADSLEAYHRIGLANAHAILDVFSGRIPSHLAN